MVEIPLSLPDLHVNEGGNGVVSPTTITISERCPKILTKIWAATPKSPEGVVAQVVGIAAVNLAHSSVVVIGRVGQATAGDEEGEQEAHCCGKEVKGPKLRKHQFICMPVASWLTA